MRITHILESIHGELPNIGKPVTIVRLTGCNLTCSYCDAPTEDTSAELGNLAIVDKVIEANNRNVLITGGEPLLQGDATIDLCERLVKAFDVTVETNGTVPIAKLREVPYLSIVMDVKLDLDWNQEIRNLDSLTVGDAIKFVYWDEASYKRAWEFISNHVADTVPFMIVFSPVDRDNAFVMDFVERAKSYQDIDIRMQVQIHKYLNCD